MKVQPQRHYGDPAAEYRAAATACGVVVRADRALVRVYGRAPRQMLNGILTNRIPEPPVATSSAILAAEAVYGAVLTPKGRMITDLVTMWVGATDEEGLGLSVAKPGREAVLAHFKRFLPPRLARHEDLSASTWLLTVAGPQAEAVVAAALGRAPGAGCALLDGGPLRDGALVARGARQAAPSWDVWVGAARLEAVWARLCQCGAAPVGSGAWDTLRVEAGFPSYGVDMDDGTIPIEAGLGDVAFDHSKGCYTGQEVIVRIRHRGRVNWHLRALRFGEAAARPGAQLFGAGGKKVRGRVTSVADSPRFGQVIGLGYVRREVEPPATLRLGSSDGAAVGVEQLPGG